jgi:hypothetical protein
MAQVGGQKYTVLARIYMLSAPPTFRLARSGGFGWGWCASCLNRAVCVCVCFAERGACGYTSKYSLSGDSSLHSLILKTDFKTNSDAVGCICQFVRHYLFWTGLACHLYVADEFSLIVAAAT